MDSINTRSADPGPILRVLKHIKNGSTIFVGTGCGEPQHLIRMLVESTGVQKATIYQMLPTTLTDYIGQSDFLNRFFLRLFFIGDRMRKAASEGTIDYVPCYLSQIPLLFDTKEIPIDYAFIQVSPPDNHGYCSLGVSVDITQSGARNATTVIAQANACMPKTLGHSFIHINDIHHLFFYDEPLIEIIPAIKDSDTVDRIGKHVSRLITDGATIQLGFGHLPYGILKHLEGKKDLGLHTQFITDGFLPLFEKNVITNKKKNFYPEKTAASFCLGSKKIFQFINNNPMFFFEESKIINDPNVISKNNNMISISSALEVDLTGQVCSDSIGPLFFSGIGDQVDFIRGSAMSKGGYSITAIPSTAKNGGISRIVPNLNHGAGVTTTRGDVHYIVTEFGTAKLYGKSIGERAMSLIQIAHPRFRKELTAIAERKHYLLRKNLS